MTTGHTRSVLLGVATCTAAVVLAGTFAAVDHRSLGELPSFFLWCVPIGVTVGVYSKRARFPRLPAFARALLAAFFGHAIGIGLTLLGWALIGGWMLAWNFPVLYCWTTAAVLGMLAATLLQNSIRIRDALIAGVLALAPLVFLWQVGNRPTPAVLIVYRDTSAFDAAQFVLDSLLTIPYPGGGRDLRWPSTTYSRGVSPLGETTALIGLERAADRDSIRAVLAGQSLVKVVIDTIIPP